MTPDNLLIAEPLLIARLRAVLPSEVHVLSASDLAGVAGSEQPTPAVHVLYQGYQVANARTPAAVEIEQDWITVVVTRNVADIETGFHARQEAGPLAAQVMDALYRHNLRAPGEVFGPGACRLAAAPQPGFDDGHFYLPLGWTIPITFRSDACPT